MKENKAAGNNNQQTPGSVAPNLTPGSVLDGVNQTPGSKQPTTGSVAPALSNEMKENQAAESSNQQTPGSVAPNLTRGSVSDGSVAPTLSSVPETPGSATSDH